LSAKEANEGIEIFSDKIESPRSLAVDWSIGLSMQMWAQTTPGQSAAGKLLASLLPRFSGG
jgi:hypothetical protein